MKMASTMPMAHRTTKEDRERELRWQAEEDMRALQRVADIRKSPARMKMVRKLLEGAEGVLSGEED